MIDPVKEPCYLCTDRHAGCAIDCQRWKTAQSIKAIERAAIQKIKADNQNVNDYHRALHIKISKRAGCKA